MLTDNLRLLLQLYVKPRRALGEILDEGSLLFALAAVLLASLVSSASAAIPFYKNMEEQLTHQQEALTSSSPTSSSASPAVVRGARQEEDEAAIPDPSSQATPRGMAVNFLGSFLTTSTLGGLVALAALYIPGCILAATFLAPIGSFSVAFRRDYASLLVCTLFSWAGAHLPFALLGLVLGMGGAGQGWILTAWLAGFLLFAIYLVLSLRTVLGLEAGTALATAGLAIFALALLPVAPMLASPFLLYWGWQYFRGDVSDIQWSFGRRQSFKRHLQAATLNPKDAEAHYQLGLIYQQRRQIPEAVERFTKAIEIDAGEVDAQYQLGRIERALKKYPEAIRRFEQVVSRDPTHARHEVWREIGATYAESGDKEHARWALEKYVAQRPHDPEGLCRLGEILADLGDEPGAREQFRRAVEAADTMPAYRRREVSEWKRRAKRRVG